MQPLDFTGLDTEQGKLSRSSPVYETVVIPRRCTDDVAHFIIGTASHIIDLDILLEFGQTPDRILDSVKSVVVRGCLTEAGLKQFDNRK